MEFKDTKCDSCNKLYDLTDVVNLPKDEFTKNADYCRAIYGFCLDCIKRILN